MALTELTHENFDKVVNENEIVFIDFWAQWCGPCKSFAPIYEQVAEKYPNIIFAKVDIDKEPQLAADFNIRSIPLVMVLKQQVMIYSESGALPASALENLVEQALVLDLSDVHQQIDEEDKDKD